MPDARPLRVPKGEDDFPPENGGQVGGMAGIQREVLAAGAGKGCPRESFAVNDN